MIKLENKQYTFWELLQKVGIKVPIIQRDYAQGRNNKQAKDIRDNFLNSLLETLEGEKKLIDLDFIYGTVKNNYLILLDGQQRLTTLFLLHCFLGLKENKLDDNNKKILEKFTYETRLSSREFIQLLINKHIELKDELISTTIKNQTWFFSDWENDPTIKGMLVMLDSIQDIFKDIEEDLFEKLISQEKKQITFSFLDLDEFKLTDELYIKMNARGKPLTEFENFKSKFENFIENEQIKAKLDNRWYDIFWKIGIEKNKKEPAKEADKLFLNFFKNITAFYRSEFNNIDIFKFEYSKEMMDDITGVLDCLSDTNNKIINKIIKELRNEKVFNISLFDNFIEIDSSKAEYEKRLRFYALMKFFLKEETVSNKNEELFKKWMRFSLNIIHNTNYNSIVEFNRDKNLLDEAVNLLGSDFYTNLSNSNILETEQFKEEKLKAKLISKQLEIENDFIKIENHWYLDGQIGFLIEYANSDDKFNKKEFKQYRDKFIALWDFIKDNQDNKILLYKALLSKGDYLPQNGSNYTFCSFETSVRAKSENWQKVFNDQDKSEFLKELLNNINENDIGTSLQKHIDDFTAKEKINCDEEIKYRYTLIQSDIRYCKKLQIRYIDYNQVYLLKTTQMNGAHSELFSWDLFINKFGKIQESERKVCWRLESQKTFNPFQTTWYYESTSRHNPPCIVLSDFKFEKQNIQLDIGYKDDSFYLSLYYENEKELHNKILNVIKKLGFNKDNIKENIDSDNIFSEIEQICAKLNELAK